MALLCASMSKDPRTRVGAVIVGSDLEVRSTGFNGFPRGVADTPERLQDKSTKLRLIGQRQKQAFQTCVFGAQVFDLWLHRFTP